MPCKWQWIVIGILCMTLLGCSTTEGTEQTTPESTAIRDTIRALPAATLLPTETFGPAATPTPLPVVTIRPTTNPTSPPPTEDPNKYRELLSSSADSPVKVTEMWGLEAGFLGGIVYMELVPTDRALPGRIYHIKLWSGEKQYGYRCVEFSQQRVQTLSLGIPGNDKIWALSARGELLADIFTVKVGFDNFRVLDGCSEVYTNTLDLEE